MSRYPVRWRKAYWKRHVCPGPRKLASPHLTGTYRRFLSLPLERTNLSRLKKSGLCGAYRMQYLQSASTNCSHTHGASSDDQPRMPLGRHSHLTQTYPGWPPLNCWHRSAMSTLNVLSSFFVNSAVLLGQVLWAFDDALGDDPVFGENPRSHCTWMLNRREKLSEAWMLR